MEFKQNTKVESLSEKARQNKRRNHFHNVEYLRKVQDNKSDGDTV